MPTMVATCSWLDRKQRLRGTPSDDQAVIYLEHNGWLARTKGRIQHVALHAGTTAFGQWYRSNNPAEAATIAASIAAYGKGKIAATYFTMGQRFMEAATTVVRDFLDALVDELFPNPLVEVAGLRFVDVTVNRIHGKLAINLVNTSGPHHDPSVHVFDETSQPSGH